MEAVPRLPMISFDVKVNTEIVSFSPKLKQYISSFYHEDPEAYNNEIHTLETLRAAAVRPTIDVSGCQMLKKYYCQLHFLKSRFPMEDGQTCAVYFSWRDNYSNMVCSVPDIDFELMNILYDIGAVHSKLGAEDSRVTLEGMKMACTHFQCAAWAFQTVRETYPQMVSLVLAPEVIQFMHLTCLAQAQECILEKSMMDNRKATIISKVAVQVVDYYKQALATLQTSGEEGSLSDLLGSRTYKDWIKYLNFKVAYHKAIALLYQGQQAEEQQKMGERVAFYQAASEQLQEACKRASNLSHQQEIGEALAFTGDVVEGKKKAAKNENEFIYHEDVPDKDALQEMKGASLVKGIAFNVNDVEVSGPDIFARLVPMEAHEASSLYSEQKAHMLRQLGELVENKDRSLAEFISSMQLDVLTQMRQASGLTQDLVDRAAAMSARPTAIQDLVSSMAKLSNTYHDVEAMLTEIDGLLKEEEKKEQDYQSQMGTRPPSIIATDLTREFTKYQEAHSKASDSNQNLHRAMTTHIANLKVLALPLSQLKQQIPSVELPNREVDEEVIREMETLLAKVEEMKNQRSLLWAQLHDAVKNDDITGLLVTRPPEKSLEQLFQQELQKHQRQAGLIEQNMAAQENILKALIDTYARFTNTRRYLQEVISKRTSTLSALVNSYDTYEDLLSKANKGLEFYNKLETNVTKLLQRIKSTCKVQDEEREQMLAKHNKKKIVAPSSGPKLKDYLEPKLKDYIDAKTVDSIPAAVTEPITSCAYSAPVSGMVSNVSDQTWPPAVRPAPLGSEMNTDTVSSSYANEQGYYANYSAAANPNQMYYNPAYTVGSTTLPSETATYSSNYNNYNYPYTQPYSDKITEQDLNERMAALMSSKQALLENREYAQQIPANQPYGYSTNTANSSNPQVLPNPNVYQPAESFSKQETTGVIYSNTTSLAEKSGTYSSGLYSYQPNNYTYGTSVAQDANTSSYSTSVSQAASNLYSTSLPQDTVTTYTTNVQPNNLYTQYIPPPNSYVPANDNTHALPVVPPKSYAQENCNYSYMQPVPAPSSYTSTGNNTYMPSTAVPSSYVSGIQASSDMYIQDVVPPNNYAQANSNYYTQTVAAPNNYANSSLPTQPIQTATSYPNTFNQPVNQSKAHSTDYNNSNATIQDSNIYPDNYNIYQQYDGQISSTQPVDAYSTKNTYDTTYSAQAANYYPYSNQPVQGTMNYANYTNTASVNQQTAVATVASGIINYPNATITQSTSTNSSEQSKKDKSNIDLLSGLDFTINQAPLVPQQNKAEIPIKEIPVSKPVEQTIVNSVKSKSEEKVTGLKDVLSVEKKHSERQPQKNPFKDPEVGRLFTQEVEKFEKFVDVLTTKTLNGPTPLDLKWKELQDKQEMEQQQKSISVARCYPRKNRFPDILPYDQTRVQLTTTKDDYINASYIKNITSNSPVFIVTQSPLQSTFNEFWILVWEQQIEIIICLLNDSEVNRDMYWPKENERPLSLGNIMVSLQTMNIKEYWTERIICINHLEQRSSRIIRHVQFTTWPSSLFPTCPAVVDFVNEVLKDHKAMDHPVLIHCLAGIGRSGLLCLLIAAVTEVLINPTSLPDLLSISFKLCSGRKNIIRDREHFKFAYYAFLHFLKEICLNQVGGKWSIEDSSTVQTQPSAVNKPADDPLSMLDPLWASKKNT